MSLPPRDHIPENALFDEKIRKILREYDVFARADSERDVAARFHALRGKELGFSRDSLKRWLLLRRRYCRAGNGSNAQVTGSRKDSPPLG